MSAASPKQPNMRDAGRVESPASPSRTGADISGRNTKVEVWNLAEEANLTPLAQDKNFM